MFCVPLFPCSFLPPAVIVAVELALCQLFCSIFLSIFTRKMLVSLGFWVVLCLTGLCCAERASDLRSAMPSRACADHIMEAITRDLVNRPYDFVSMFVGLIDIGPTAPTGDLRREYVELVRFACRGAVFGPALPEGDAISMGVAENKTCPGASLLGTADSDLSECEALHLVYVTTGGPTEWWNRSGWEDETHVRQSCCAGDLRGVGCSADRTHVVSLDLSSNNLAGTLPTAIGDLVHLQRMYLHFRPCLRRSLDSLGVDLPCILAVHSDPSPTIGA